MKKETINLLMFALSAIIMASLIPTNGMFRYDINHGEEWNDKSLYAPYDFPILKSEEEYKSDVKEFEKYFLPIYYRDTLISAELREEMKQYLSLSTKELKPEMLKSLSGEKKAHVVAYNTINHFYSNGVIYEYDDGYSSLIVRIVNGDKLESYSKKNLYTVSSAKELLKNMLAFMHVEERDRLLLELDRFIVADIQFDNELTAFVHDQELKQISTTKGFVRKGRAIIEQGEIITPERNELLNSFKQEHLRLGGREVSLMSYFGNLFYVSLILLLSYLALYIFNRDFLRSVRNGLFLMLLYIGIMISAVLVINTEFYPLSIYLVPFAIFPFYLNNFFGSRIANYQYTFALLIVSMVSSTPFEFMLYNYLAGVSGMYLLHRAYRRNKFFWAVLVTLLVYMLLYTVMTTIQDGDFSGLQWKSYVWFMINSVLLIALYQLLYLIEKIFRFVSNATLLELCDTNNKLIQEMARNAPGTYQHAVQVANLSETAAKAIGANHLLARAGALYHDIGKCDNALMFVENNSGESLHDKISELQSAQAIRAHVEAGVRMAKRGKLPKIITDFIATHHGDSLIYYFYKTYKDKNPELEVKEEDFRYFGPKPDTKETTICMIADAVEAAARTLKEHTPQSISNLIDNIVKGQMNGGQYDNSPLTLEELEKVKNAFKRRVTTIYHSRIEYPK